MKTRPELLAQLPIPMCMHGVCPRNIMGSAWWEEQKRIAYAATDGRCAVCSRVHIDGLEAHECYNIDYREHTMKLREIVGLCYRCHNYIHAGFMRGLVNSGDMTEREMNVILKRGYKILKKAGLHKPLIPQQFSRWNWSRWRLIFNGQEYKSKFKNYEAWRKYYAT